MKTAQRHFAIVTGASSGIGYYLAHFCSTNGFDLLIAADEPQIQDAAEKLRENGTTVDAIQADLATLEGNDGLYAATQRRPWMPCWQMLAMAWVDHFWIRTSARCGTSLTPTSREQSI